MNLLSLWKLTTLCDSTVKLSANGIKTKQAMIEIKNMSYQIRKRFFEGFKTGNLLLRYVNNEKTLEKILFFLIDISTALSSKYSRSKLDKFLNLGVTSSLILEINLLNMIGRLIF